MILRLNTLSDKSEEEIKIINNLSNNLLEQICQPNLCTHGLNAAQTDPKQSQVKTFIHNFDIDNQKKSQFPFEKEKSLKISSDCCSGIHISVSTIVYL